MDLVQRAELELREKAQWRLRDIQALRDLVVVHPGMYTSLDEFVYKFLTSLENYRFSQSNSYSVTSKIGIYFLDTL